MSIKNISKAEKLEVLFRLITKNEKFEDACSKSGLSFNDVKSIILSNK